MTHRHKMSLLGDFVDNELTGEDLAEFKRLLAESEDLRDEHELTVRLRELLRQNQAPDPGAAYFDELTRLIEARTVDSRTAAAPLSADRPDPVYQRRMFVRALLSAAASLFLFFAALTVGSRHSDYLSQQATPDAGVFFAGTAAEQVNSQVPELATAEERTSVSQGIFLLSPPGSIGRLTGLQDVIGR